MFFFLFRNKCSALSRSPIFKWWQQSRARIRTKRLSSVWLQPQAIFVDPAPFTWFLNVAPIWQITSWILQFYWNVNETAWTKTLSSRKLEIRLVKLLIRKGVERWFFSLNTNNLAFTVWRSTASLFFHTLYSWIVNQSPIALTYLLPHCKGYERGELTFWRQMRHYRSFQMVKRPQTGTIKSVFNHTSLKWHELLILQRKKGPKYFCQIFSSNVFLLLWYVLSLSVLATSWIRVIRPTI